MFNRRVSMLALGFGLLCGSPVFGQLQAPFGNSLPSYDAGQSVQSYPLSTSEAQQGSDTGAIANRWQRLPVPPDTGSYRDGRPADVSSQKIPVSRWSFASILGRDDSNSNATNSAAAKPGAIDRPNSSSMSIIADSCGTNSCADASSQGVRPYPAGGIGTVQPAVNANNYAGTLPEQAAARNYGSASTQQRVRTVAAADSAPNLSPKNVRGAFAGILGDEDDKEQKRSGLPLLAPYKNLPVGYLESTSKPTNTSPAVASSPSASPNYGNTISDQTQRSTTQPTIGINTTSHGTVPATSTKTSGVQAAFANLVPSDPTAQELAAPTSNIEPSALPAIQQAVAAEPLNLNNVEAQQIAGSPLNRPKIIYHPASTVMDKSGQKVIRPDVQLATVPTASDDSSSVQLAEYAVSDGPAPEPMDPAPETAYPIDEQQWAAPFINDQCNPHCNNCRDHHGGCGCDCDYGGVGREYVMYAPFFIHTTQPFNNCFIQGDAARDWEFPDRAEYFWAKTPGGRGPVDPGIDPVTLLPLNRGERSVNYQEVDLHLERAATDRVGIATDIPFRLVDPEFRDDTAGLGDMTVSQKAVLLDGKCWQLTQILDTRIPTGSVHHGTGDGHVSMNAGIAYRYKWSEDTYMHGDFTYLFPIGADKDFSGQIFNYGIGFSHVWIDTDTYALIPTLELLGWTVVDGRETLPGSVPNVQPPATPTSFVATSVPVNSIGILNISPGLRWVCDKGRDCGVKEFGISSGIALTEQHFYEEILRIQFRWSR
jgi:hypothetical protein